VLRLQERVTRRAGLGGGHLPGPGGGIGRLVH
jgi:hypothetical protein